MIEKMSERIALFLIINGAVRDEETDVCRYGIEVMISNMLCVLLVSAASLLLGCIDKGILFLLFFAAIRVYTGGYHAKTYYGCNIAFLIVFLATILIAKYVDIMLCNSLWIMTIIGFGIVIKWAPIEHKNKMLNDTDRKKYRNISGCVYFITIIIIHLLENCNYERFSNVCCYIKEILLAIVILMAIAKVNERRDCDEEQNT